MQAVEALDREEYLPFQQHQHIFQRQQLVDLFHPLTFHSQLTEYSKQKINSVENF